MLAQCKYMPQRGKDDQIQVSYFTSCPTFSVFSSFELFPAVSGRGSLAELIV